MIGFPVVAYAETHYRFKYFFSYLRTKEPEIIFDAPHRLEPHAELPILFIVKDADLYPTQIRSLTITLRSTHTVVYETKKLFSPSLIINKHLWWNIFHIPFVESLLPVFGALSLDIQCEYFVNGRIRRCRNNNHRTSSKAPLNIYRSKNSLPALPGWMLGEVHSHSQYTEDQVEFGVPIPAAKELVSALGLNFFCVTDHSYDLDDTLSSYLKNDPELPKWKMFQEEVDIENRRGDAVTVIRGEEVTAKNSRGRNIHFLLYGVRKFLHGTGDSADKWLRTNSEYTIPEIIKNVEPTAVLYASHPTEPIPLLQQFFLGRDEWALGDMSNDGIHGLQILNGELEGIFTSGFAAWKTLLLQGKKLFIAAGNDAHGNFNRFIQIGFPFFAIREKETQIFGRMKTLLFAQKNTESDILHALRTGKSVATNGPIALFEIENSRHHSVGIGETLSGKEIVIKLRGVSSEEFGQFSSVRILQGIIGQAENLLLEFHSFSSPFEFHFITEWQAIESFSYIRIEAFTINGKGKDADGFCYTNPIWISPE